MRRQPKSPNRECHFDRFRPRMTLVARPSKSEGQRSGQVRRSEPMEAYLAVIWAAILAFAVAMYVVMDGFDLGIGILFPTTRDEVQRDQMMNSVAPFWDGNETWLVLGGVGLLVAFPLAYSILMPALYIPVIVMLLGLILRGVAFEFRWVAKPRHGFWDGAFFLGSLSAAFAQGCVLGGFLQGVQVADGEFAGRPFDWLTPFSVFC